jgi:hypothetical protein
MSKKIIQLNNDLFSCKRINVENFQDGGEEVNEDIYTDEDGNVFIFDYNINDWVLQSDAAAATGGDAAAADAGAGDAGSGEDTGDIFTDEDGNVWVWDYNINDWALQSEPASAAAAGGDAAVAGGDAARTTAAVTLDATGNMVAPGPKPKKPKRKSKKRSKKPSKPRGKVGSKKTSKKPSKKTSKPAGKKLGKAPSKGGSKKASKGKRREGFCAGNTCLTEDNLKSLIKLLKKLELKK